MPCRDFATLFSAQFRELYGLAARRVADGRALMSAETTALLMHLAQSGPLTLSEMAQHFGRALSTLSVKVAALEADGLLARQRDDGDARRALIWLGPHGRAVLDEALQVLDTPQLAAAAERLAPAMREQLLQGLAQLLAALRQAGPGAEATPEAAHESTPEVCADLAPCPERTSDEPRL